MQSGTPHELIDRALDACSAWNALGCELRDVDHARFVRNTSFADVPGTNRVSHVAASTPGEIRDLLALAAATFAGVPSLTFEVDHRTPPPFEARLVVDGFAPHDSLVMLLEGELHGSAPACDVRPIAGADDWRAWEALSTDDNIGYPVRPGVAADHAEASASPPAAARNARRSAISSLASTAQPAGFFSAWEGIDGVGVVENLSCARRCAAVASRPP